MRTTVFVLAVLTQVTTALGQPTASWTQIQTASPGARYGHSMAFDRARDRAIIFAGIPGWTDVWELQSQTWQSMGSGPGARSEAFMVYDEVRHVTVLFGGNLGGYTDDLYEYDGATWQRRFPNYSPPPMLEHRMWFDDLAGKVYLYGGASNGQLAAGVWSWDGSRWRLVSASPPKLLYPAIAFDRIRHVAVLFGGYQNGVNQSQTWEFDGFHWLQRFPLTSPPARYLNVAAFHEGIGKVVMHGGAPNFGDTWEWDGTNWLLGNAHGRSSPGMRYHTTMVYDNIRERCLLFGGYNGSGQAADTWAYQLPPNMEAGDFNVEMGMLVSGDLESLRDSDDEVLVCDVTPDNSEIQVQFASLLFLNLTLNQVWFRVESATNRPGVITVELFNFSKEQWEPLAQSLATETDNVLWAGVNENGNVYRGPYSLTLARVRFAPIADDLCSVNFAIDRVGWTAAN